MTLGRTVVYEHDTDCQPAAVSSCHATGNMESVTGLRMPLGISQRMNAHLLHAP